MDQTRKLEQLMNEQKLTIQKVSELTGVSTLALEYLVQEQNMPKTHVAQKIAKVLQMPVLDIWPNLRDQ